LALLPDCQRCEENKNETVLAERKPELGMACNLEKEVPISALE
jgi:hypothetical protein